MTAAAAVEELKGSFYSREPSLVPTHRTLCDVWVLSTIAAVQLSSHRSE
jgi:hypothetical protein